VTGRQFLKWNNLKNVFEKYHTEKCSRDFLIKAINEYQFTNGIKTTNNKVLNCRGKEWKKSSQENI